VRPFLKRFLREEAGAVTVESILWMAFFFWILMLMADVSFAFLGRVQALRIVEDGNRAYALRRLDTEEDAEAWIEAQYARYSPSAQASTVVSSGIVATALTFPARDLTLFNTLNVLGGQTMTVRTQHHLE
jgi:Flp pilus assembly protein TadG